MLEELRITNFAIIDTLTLRFSTGLNVITGETGAGKSIIIDAVELLLGGRSDPSMLRAGAQRAVVEGTFALAPSARAHVGPVLLREGLADNEADADTITLTREVRATGRSSARVNGATVTQDVLREIGGFLVDIHGQSEHLSLLKPSAHLDLLDRYAGLFDLRDALATLVARLGGVRRALRTLQDDKDALDRRAERLREAIDEIDAAALRPGEEDELRAERTRLANSEQLATLVGQATLLLDGDDGARDDALSAVDQLQQVALLLGKLAAIDASLGEDAQLADALSQQAQDLALTLRDYADSVEYSPRRLDQVEERLELIATMRRRYGAAGIDAVLAYADEARTELDTLDNSAERIAALAADEQALLKHVGELGGRISEARQKAGQALAARIVTELADLRMANARFEVGVVQHTAADGAFVGKARYAFDATGIDDVQFMMSANPGMPLMPLAKVASGGETARIMLALKRALALADQTPTLIFDEIDQGIGGRVGAVVGEKLWNLSLAHQVMVVTHLAQLAGFADAHYRVEKRVINGVTATYITPLSDDAALLDELAAMLGTQGEGGQQGARELLGTARSTKEAAPTANPHS